MDKKWLVLGLAALTSMLVFAMPVQALPVLFTEISEDLNLTVFQVGLIWGAASLAGFLTSILYGMFGDRFGPKRTLVTACLLVGILGAARGLASSAPTFMILVLIHSMSLPSIPPNVHKTAGMAMPDRRGLAAGMVSAGFALGLALSSALSASLLSPWLGNWERVLIFYGIIAVIMALLWYLLYPADLQSAQMGGTSQQNNLLALRHILQSRQIWIIGVGTLCFWICYKGFSGYLPLYLKNEGWDPVLADQTLTTFFFVSLLGVLPLSYVSDRLGIKRELMMVAVGIISVGTLAMGFTQGIIFWVALVMGGFLFDAFMAIHQASVLEIDGIGGAMAGTALGVVATLRDLGGFIGPPIGNALATQSPAAPFYFWGIMGLVGVVIYSFLPRQRREEAIT